MPIYVYYCKQCDKHFDAFNSIKENQEAICPECLDFCEKDLMETIKSTSTPAPFYPGHDPGLGCYIDSREHRKKVCKEKGVQPTG